MRKSRKNGFTLIEMLTVIVIIVIILSIGLPAFTNLMKSGGLSGAQREVANALGLARQYAITHRTKTRVLFPYSGTIVSAADTNSTILCPLYLSYAVLDMGPTNYISKWEHLPAGTVFMDSNPLLGNPPASRPCLDNLQTTSFIPFPYTNSVAYPLAYIEFQPTGAATPSPSGGPSSFTLTEGYMSGANVMPTSKTSTSIVNRAIISVDIVIGRIQVTRP